MDMNSVLVDGVPVVGPSGGEEKRYVELFRQVAIHTAPGGAAVVDIELCDEKDSPEEAEVCLPFHTDDTVYGVVCYLTGIPCDQPAVGEMMFLQNFAGAMVAMTEEITLTETTGEASGESEERP